MLSCKPQAILHMEPRESRAVTLLTESETLLEGITDLESLHWANRRGILPSGRRVIFQ